MSKLSFVNERFQNFDYEYHNDYIYIVNPKNQRRIYIDYACFEYYVEGQNSLIHVEEEYTFRFETQHIHFSDKDSLLQCIDEYTCEKIFAIEFFKDGKNRFGGDIKVTNLTDITPKVLASRFGYSPSQLNGMTFEIKSWNGTYDLTGRIEKTENEYRIV